MIGHVLVDFFLEVDADRSVGADDFVGADAGGGRNISSRIGDADVCGIIAHGVMGAFDGCGNEVVQEALSARRQLQSGRRNRLKTSEA